MKKFLILVVAGVVIAGILYVTFPVPMTTYGGMGLNYFKSLNAPAGTLITETNPAYQAPAAVASGSPPDRPAFGREPPQATGRATTGHRLRSVSLRSTRSTPRTSPT